LIVNNTLPVKSVKEFIAYVRTRPGQLHYGSAGNGAPSHLAMELFKVMTQTQFTHVPYKGMAPALNDVFGGQIQLSLPTIPGGLPHAQAGRVRALGVSGTQRSPAAPDVPTIAEAGVPGYEAANWYGIAVPAGVSRAIVAALNQEITRIVILPDVRARLRNLGLEAETAMPDAYANYLKSEVVKWGRVVKSAGIRMD
jgi:tripartite-type tricarboxylate transporter receptor subunit TctC